MLALIQALFPLLILACVGLMALAALLGRKMSKRKSTPSSNEVGTVRSVTFSLFGLLMAFAVNSASQGYTQRREAIREESVAIRSAYDLLSGLPENFQEAIRPMFHAYVDLRYQAHSPSKTEEEITEINRQTASVEVRIWDAALAASVDPATSELGPAFRLRVVDMIKERERQDFISSSHPPLVVFLLLVAIGLYTSFYVGYGLEGSDTGGRGHLIGYAVLVGLMFYLVLDLEFPRLGLIHMDSPSKIRVSNRDMP